MACVAPRADDGRLALGAAAMPLRACGAAARAAAFALVTTLALPALAINEMFAKDAPIARMTAEDFEIAGAVMRKALDEGQDGHAYPWTNPATSASGTVTPLASFTRQGLHCRGAAFTITTRGETSRSAWNLCRMPDGWKVAEGR
jgi:surface antigen